MSRRTWERHQNKRDATSSAISFLIKNDRLATPAGGARMASERGFASKEVRERPSAAPPKAAIKARGYPPSQTATTMAADRHESLPIELRLLALGLPIPENLARAA